MSKWVIVSYVPGRLLIRTLQVERIGVACGHLPDVYPFSQTTTTVITSDDVLFESSDNGLSDSGDAHSDGIAARPSMSNPQLVEALADVQVFRNLYLNLTKKAIMAYEACGKANANIRLKADLAGLAL